ncbi:MAG: head GIN domain-containing protein [Bacteroidota bacterium]
MRRLTVLSVVALIIAMCWTGCDGDGVCVKGSGETVSQVIAVPDFDGIDLEIDADVFITQGEPQQVEVNAQQNILDEIERDVQNGTWEIELDGCIRNHDDIKIYITMPRLEKVHLSGSGDIQSQNVINTDDIDLRISGSGDIDLQTNADDITSRISGSGKIRLSGTADEHEMQISGSGDLESYDLITRSTDIRISGSGDAQVDVEEFLKVRISGSGDVRYEGNPTLDVEVTGSGDVRPR